jgi:hypothetical protein
MTRNDETSAIEPSDTARPRPPHPGGHPRTLDPGDRLQAPDPVATSRAEHKEARARAPDPEEKDPLHPLFTDDLLQTMTASLPSTEQEPEHQKTRRMAAAVIALRSLDAQEPIQAMLATHVVLAHHAVMQCYRRAAQENQPPDLANPCPWALDPGGLFGNAVNLSRTLTGVPRDLERRQDRAAWLAGREIQRWCR